MPGREILTRTFLNQDFSSLESIIVVFMEEAKITKTPSVACFAVYVYRVSLSLMNYYILYTVVLGR